MAIKKSEIYSSLWASCDELRGGMDASQYKDYILTLLFVKYVSDKFKGEKYPDIKIPENGSFDDIIALKGTKDIGEGIDKVIGKLADENNLRNVIDNAHFNDEAKIGKGQEMVDKLTKIVSIFQRPELDFKNNRVGGDDILGDAYEYLMRNFATESGKSKGQFYTPAEVSRVLAKIIDIDKATNKQNVCDPACGSGSLLIKVADEAHCDIAIYGQEKETTTAGLAIMNFVLHNKATGEIKADNTFAAPQYFEDDEHTTLKRFDYVVANPPFSLKNWSNGIVGHEYGRFAGYDAMPPEKNGDYAWLLHIIKSMKTSGKAAVILPHGVLFRGNAEAAIRKNIIDNGYIKGIIGLPANLFYGTGIPACIIMLDKESAEARKGIFMIDASRDFVKDGNKNRLRERDIYKIVTTFNAAIEETGYSRMVTIDEIKNKNDYNLNIPRYIDGGVKEDLQDITAHLQGGIPASDIDDLSRYWGEFVGLKEKLFTPLREGYYKLNVEKEIVRDTIYNDHTFENYGKKVEQAYEKWQKIADELLFNINNETNPKALIVEIAERIVAEFEDVKLIDKHDVYQVLLAYWQTIMADDVYLIKNDGYEVGSEYDYIYSKNRKKDGSESKKETGWEGKIIPKELIITKFFAEDKLAVDEAQRFIEEAQSRLDELSEQENEEDDSNETNVIAAKAAISLKKDISEKTKIVKALVQQLDDNVKSKYAELTLMQIQDLLINRKWHTQIYEGIYLLYKTVSQRITERIVEITERYEQTLPEINKKVALLEKKVQQHLKAMGFKSITN
ncbi:MAG: type I restriction-modification system subunit M [Bacteroidales bacterium]|jgi:type I restriction enzyme M protein|nr:type I restriction-modification system subunit M [Bacteroidales bacterium]